MRTRRHRRASSRRVVVAAAAAATTSVALLGGGAAPAAAADCGAQAVAQPFIDHIDSAHLERSPAQQARDLMHVDSYVLAHTVLAESMLAPLVPTAADVLAPFVAHVETAHLERSPLQQAKDLLHVDDYVLAHTVLVEAMLAPVLGSCADAGGGAPAPMPAHGMAPAPAAPAAPAAPVAPVAIGIHGYAYDPATLTVPVGTTITWTNHDADSHTVTGSGLKSPSFGAGGTFSYAFTRAGTFTYACALHPQMKGTITVA
jgi:plastocyanin